MVVGAVESVALPAQRALQVDILHIAPAQLLGLLNGGAVVYIGGIIRQVVGPGPALVRHQGEVDRHVQVFPQLVDEVRPGGKLLVRDLGEMGEEGLAALNSVKVDLVVLLLAQGPLRVCLHLHPLVPEGELVIVILLEFLHELPGAHRLPGGGPEQSQVFVLLLGKLPVGEDEVGGAEAENEQAEQRRNKNRVFFAHKHIPNISAGGRRAIIQRKQPTMSANQKFFLPAVLAVAGR